MGPWTPSRSRSSDRSRSDARVRAFASPVRGSGRSSPRWSSHMGRPSPPTGWRSCCGRTRSRSTRSTRSRPTYRGSVEPLVRTSSDRRPVATPWTSSTSTLAGSSRWSRAGSLGTLARRTRSRSCHPHSTCGAATCSPISAIRRSSSPSADGSTNCETARSRGGSPRWSRSDATTRRSSTLARSWAPAP